MIKQFSIKLLFFLIPILLPLYFFTKEVDKKTRNLFIEKPSYVISIKNQHYDYIVGGSSRVHNNFNTLLFDSVTGKKGFNIGYDGSGLAQIYLTLYFYLKNGNTTKFYLQQIEDNFLIDPKKALIYPFHDYFFIPYLGDEEIDDCFKKNVPILKYYIWKYIPYIKYAEFNNYYSLRKIFGLSKTDEKMILMKGYNRLQYIHQPNFPASSYKIIDAQIDVDPVNMYYLNKIKNLCDQYKVQFILYSSPLYQKSYYCYKYKNLHDSLLNFVSRNHIPYFNFMTNKEFLKDSLFYDETHLNALGTDVFTKQLGETLKLTLQN